MSARASVRVSIPNMGGTLCAQPENVYRELYIHILWRDSAQTTSHICTFMVPINCTIIVGVQHIFHFYLDLNSDPGQGHKNLVFLHTLYKTGDTLCA